MKKCFAMLFVALVLALGLAPVMAYADDGGDRPLVTGGRALADVDAKYTIGFYSGDTQVHTQQVSDYVSTVKLETFDVGKVM